MYPCYRRCPARKERKKEGGKFLRNFKLARLMLRTSRADDADLERLGRMIRTQALNQIAAALGRPVVKYRG